ncbi:MAG: ATP-binding protein, partial [Desulfuromonas sp.]|nr:ATP-binding protein [Desulfuromonas sp.]
MIERTFKNIQEDDLSNADQQSFLVNLGWSSDATWEDLLRSKRVLIISEAGAGKTYECRKLAQRLWDAGEPAFFLELAQLASTDLRSMLDNDEETRLDAWLSSQSDVATFFLDSIDELKLSLGSFELALKHLKKGIGNQLGRTQVVITTRPIAFDERLVRHLLPIPPEPSTESSEETFAKIAMREHQNRQAGNKDEEATGDWRTVALMPLSDAQIVEFARVQGVKEPALLLSDLQKRNAQEFARRPQDLIELCADWKNHKRIRTHRDQVATNVRIKLQPRNDRPELAELSADKAIEGASRLALAMQVTRRLTIKHSTASDVIEDEAAIDPTVILSDWKPNERKTLLERPLFGFASY